MKACSIRRIALRKGEKMPKPWFNHPDYKDYDDYKENFKIDIPDNFNFGFDCVDALAESEPDLVAIMWDSDEEEGYNYTFAEVKKYSDAIARYFLSLGIGKGDRVMLIMKRRIHWWFTLIALIKIGAIAIPATHHLTADDIEYRNNSAGIKAIVTADSMKLFAAVEEALPKSPTVEHLIRIGDQIENYSSENYEWNLLDKEMKSHLEGEQINRVTENEDIMLLYFTSGTTGMPKMVLHNQTYPLAHIVTAKYWHNLHPGSRHFTLSDTGWGKAVWGKLFGQWLCKASVLVYDHDKLIISKMIRMLEKHKITSFCAPPTVYKVALTADVSKYDLSALEYATSAGEPLNDAVYYKFEELTGIKIHEAYGQTETVPVVLTSPYTQPLPGSLGKPNPFYDLKFLDADGNDVPVGTEGEMCIVTKPGNMGIFMGYFNNDEMTEKAWAGGVYHTGDLAYQDENGYVYFIGRTDDIIKSAGYRIGPFEVESVVQQHDAVLEVAVTGVPDPLRGQLIKASIILNKGYEPSLELQKEIRAFVKANTSSYKIPRVIEFVEELPKTISGKVRRAEMRAKEEEKKSQQDSKDF